MRTAFINQLIEEARKHQDIFLIVGDLGYSVVEPFAEEFPDRFLNAGIAEQNMAGVSAGLALEGFNVFMYSIGNFPTLRCLEQIRNDICYHRVNVKVVSVGAGYSYGSLGMSHHATEDLGMLRVLPGFPILSPGDPVETRLITQMLSTQQGPAYLRLGKAGEKDVHPKGFSMAWGDLIPVLSGENTAVVCHGSILHACRSQIIDEKLNYSLYSMPFVNLVADGEMLAMLLNHQRIVVVEEHQVTGGLGSVILEFSNKLRNAGALVNLPLVEIKGIDNRFVSSAGSQSFLRNLMQIRL